MVKLYQSENRLAIRNKSELVWIEPWGENSLRIRSTREPQILSQDWALSERGEWNAEILIKENGASISNGKLTADVDLWGNITYHHQNGKLLLKEYVRQSKDPSAEHCSALHIDAREFKPILGGDFSLTVRFESNPEEKLFGMGQYQQPILNLKGCSLELAQRNSQASVPFLLSSLGYGFLWNNPAIGNVVFGKNKTEWYAQSTKQMDYWITAGDTPAEIEEAYAAVTGKVPMMPDFGTGFWQSKLRYQTQQELLDVAREYKRRGLPLSVIVIDFFHWPLEGDWKFDPEYWPDPKSMIRELKEMDVELMVSVWPTVDFESENYQEMLENGYLINVERGYPVGFHLLANTLHCDATNPDARAFWWDKIKRNYYDLGIKLFWLDEAEPEYSVYDFDNYRYSLGTNLQVGNLYPKLYSKTFYDGMKMQGQENIVNLVRCAWAGSQKYGALVWSGDVHSSFISLKEQLTAGLNMGLAGIPWWTSDIGGFHGGNPSDPCYRKLFLRWFQFGTFCPVMRLHGMREPLKEPLSQFRGGRCESGSDNEVWSYGEDVFQICMKFLRIREKLRPYLKTLMQEAHENGTPVMRTMFYVFPEDPECWELEDQYMLGPDLLIAPITQEILPEQDVYLPSGEWTDVWTGIRYQGPKQLKVPTSMDKIPVYTRNQDLMSCFSD